MWALRLNISKQREEEPVTPDKVINKSSNGWSFKFDLKFFKPSLVAAL